MIANGVVFAYGSGENTAQAFPDVGLDFRMERRIPEIDTRRAVCPGCANRQGAVVERQADHDLESLERSRMANGRVYINTYDGTLYCFGLAK